LRQLDRGTFGDTVHCPAVSEKRMALTSNSSIHYQLKSPYQAGSR